MSERAKGPVPSAWTSQERRQSDRLTLYKPKGALVNWTTPLYTLTEIADHLEAEGERRMGEAAHPAAVERAHGMNKAADYLRGLTDD